MLSNYFHAKINTEKFDNDLLWSLGEIKDKKVILFGANEEFKELNKIYSFDTVLNIVAIADYRFESENSEKEFCGIRTISPTQILNEDYDVIMITSESCTKDINYIYYDLNIQNKDVRAIFNEDITEELENVNYLYKHDFDKTLPRLIKKMKNKKVVLYGAGILLEVILTYFNLRDLDIIAIADKKFAGHEEGEMFYGYKVCSPEEVMDLNPDMVLISLKQYCKVADYLINVLYKKSKIKVKLLVRKSFWSLLKECIWA